MFKGLPLIHSLMGMYGPDTVLAGEIGGDSISTGSLEFKIESLFSSVKSTAAVKAKI